ncbi:MAG: ABC transporter family substrate-binding protein [Microbacteriaceae bacterium]|nr:ABC transporter family substrate-binding protein [Microbacteriaceae bacterium]
MKNKKVAALALIAGSALLLSACAGGKSEQGKGTKDVSKSDGQVYTKNPTNSGLADFGKVETKPGEIKWASGDVFTSYNNQTSGNYSSYNSSVTDNLGTSFNYFGTDGTLYRNEEMGKYEKVSDNPLKVKYTIHKDAKWSDGEPITVADYIFSWATQSEETKGADGKPIFDAVSVDFGEKVPKGPEPKDGNVNGKEFTITFKDPNPDWEIILPGIKPVHVIAKEIGKSKADLIAAAQKRDGVALKEAAAFWNKSWNVTDKLGKPELYPSYGQYVLDSIKAGEYVTLKANKNFWGTKPATETLIVRVVDPKAAVEALQNKDVSAIAPQATVDTLKKLEQLGKQVVIHKHPSMIYEHLDFNFAGNSIFKDKKVREAFALCVPRQQIVDNLIKPLNPEAAVLNSREKFNFMPGYDEHVKEIYKGQYDKPDVEKAKQLLSEANPSTKKVRIGYNKPNPRRASTVELIKASCDKAGFEIVDDGAQGFFSPGGKLNTGDYDVALFAWSGSGQKTSGENQSGTGRPQNYGKYSNKDVDAAWSEVTKTVDEKKVEEGHRKIQKLLWDDLFTIPLYNHPGVSANLREITDVRPNVTQTGLLWNVHQWGIKDQKSS